MVQNDLPFCDISRKVGDRVGDIVVWHGENRYLGHGAVASLYDARALIDGGQLAVKVAWIAFSGGNLAFGRGYLTKRLRVGRHIR